MKPIRKAIRAAHTEHRSWKQEIHTDFAVKLVKLSTTGYLEYSSVITIK
jgi:hypothetical protein